MHSETSEPSRAGFVALAGSPNVGKSTLLNRILGRRLSIASPKPQTTRSRLLGMCSRGPVQLVFMDTPGIHRSRGLIHERMVRHATTSVRDADVTCWIVDATKGLTSVDREELAALDTTRSLALLNKTDKVKGPDLLPLMRSVAAVAADIEILPLSALSGENVKELVTLLAQRMPEGPWLYEADTVTDQNERFLAAELVREQLFLQLDEEMPYRTAVIVDEFKEGRKQTMIGATIYTNTESSKRMIIGKGGARIKMVGTKARQGIEALLGRRVYLDLHVKVREGWQEDPRFLEDLGI